MTFDVTGEGADQHLNMNPGPNGILPKGGDTADVDAGNHEHERYYGCFGEEHDQASDPGNMDVPEHVGYLGDRIQNESIEDFAKALRRERRFDLGDCQELLRRLGRIGAKAGKREVHGERAATMVLGAYALVRSTG